jgi:hypothetical protein
MGLRHFRGNEVILSQDEAWKILVFFFGGNAGMSAGDLTEDDRAFAQALLFQGMESSDQMDFVLPLFKATVSPNVFGAMKKVAKEAVKIGWRHWRHPRTTEDPKIYSSVKNQITVNWKTTWAERAYQSAVSW